MQGIELSKKYYEEFGREMIEKNFPEYKNRIAVGLVGNGSDCFGYDDELSKDHDFEPGFIMWLNDEDYDEINFKLFREYEKLPKEFLGLKRQATSFFGTGKYGVKRIGEFYSEFTGIKGAPSSWKDWMNIPEYSLAAATNGVVFKDNLGEFTEIRNEILNGMPEDVRLKKIAARAALMAQSGQYNYKRCMEHKEIGAASLALADFVKNAASIIFLLNKKHAPFYKWIFRRLMELEILSETTQDLDWIVNIENNNINKNEICKKIESVSALIIEELKNQNLSYGEWDYLEPHAYEVMKRIKDEEIRNLHVMVG